MVPGVDVRSQDLIGLLGMPGLDQSTAQDSELDSSKMGLAQYLAHREKAFIVRALEQAQGNVAATARILGLDRANLHRRLKKLGIKE